MLAPAVILVSLAVTLASPLWVLLAAPIALGTPHVVSDVRYLIVRPMRGWPLWLLAALVLPLGAFTALRAWVWLGHNAHPWLEIACGCAAAAAMVAGARGPARRGVLALAGLALLLALAWRWPWQVVVGFGHVHNLVAFALWCAWAGPVKGRAAAAALYVGAMVLLVVAAPSLSMAGAAGLGMDGLVASLAPGLGHDWGVRVVTSYAFAQLVHYGVWIAMLPAALRGPKIRDELGWIGLGAAVAGSLFIAAWGVWQPLDARATYLSFALFHGWLEVAVVAHWWVRDGKLTVPGPADPRKDSLVGRDLTAI
jgi:hypothetical protein